MLQAQSIHIKGIVQGVGFRPFVYQAAQKNGLKGWVCNTSGDVTIAVEGDQQSIDQFLHELISNPPPQSHIESIVVQAESFKGFSGFEILESQIQPDQYQLISPDLATCPECRQEIFDPSNRRYGYPFTNCTQCGPRFTIIEAMPYDRPYTTMRSFTMCPQCREEYQNAADRRFHAQPNACPRCGPQLTLTDSRGKVIATPDVLARTAELLRQGQIIAIKGMGGFLLACDATNDTAVQTLRARKQRPSKPLAVMVQNLDAAKAYCEVTPSEEATLTSVAAPIVLLRIKKNPHLSALVAPGLQYLGTMLPYTPLHHLLLSQVSLPLVMTSGNLSEEPIATGNSEALERLKEIADYFVLHNRDIYSGYDDSVAYFELDKPRIIRRARGYAPYPIHLPFTSRPVLAYGTDLKNTFCLTRDNHAFISQHIGDMENLETWQHFETTLELYQKLFHLRPELIACDLHPDYFTTQMAVRKSQKSNLPLLKIQHHYAHVVSCMADNQVQDPVIGVAFDGTGYGLDGNIWGGEFLVADYKGFQRQAHFEYLPLPGGSAAIQKPYRTAIGYLYALLGPAVLSSGLACVERTDPAEIDIIQKQIDRKLNTPLTSSAGRLFDAVSAILNIRRQIDYEGQAAIELEMAAEEDNQTLVYPFQISTHNGVAVIQFQEMLAAIITDLKKGLPISSISAGFHRTLAEICVQVCLRISSQTELRKVALSGGVFQNRLLLKQVVGSLQSAGLAPLIHTQVPCNDGGISLGQAVIASFAGKPFSVLQEN